ncbi:hypothetical protein BRC72_02115 [Halobacteriales archaeon QH_7_66_36]|nr:MAG: hypothetical protein BRC72_02115 [Halobacteriales archaeon QH_7_66_36]
MRSSDELRGRRQYRRRLYAVLSVGDKRVYVFEQACEDTGPIGELPEGCLHSGFVVSDVEAVIAEPTAAGVSMHMKPTISATYDWLPRYPNRVELPEHSF